MGLFDIADKPEDISLTEKAFLIIITPILLGILIRLIYLIVKYY